MSDTDRSSATRWATVGNALVIAAGETIGEHARGLAMSVAADPGHELVVADLPKNPTVAMWETLAEAIPRGKQPIRLVIAGGYGEATTLAGHWLAERLARTVVVPDGEVHQGANGSLLVHGGPGSGWLTCRPRQRSHWEAKRFPRPSWDSRAVGDVLATGSNGIAEPIPAGMWLHPAADDEHVARHRRRLVETIPSRPDAMTVLVGCPGMPPVRIEDVAYLRSCLPEDIRPRVRFAVYGGVDVGPGGYFGQVLAQLVQQPVVCYPGIPVGGAEWPEIHTIWPNGPLGWRCFAREVEYFPATDTTAAAPAVLTHWLPFAGVTQLESAAYWYAPDAVIEIVQAGLWLRSPDGYGHADAVRSHPCDHAGPKVFFDDSTEQSATRMHWLARDVASRMPPEVRTRTSLVAAGTVGRHAPAAPRPEQAPRPGPVQFLRPEAHGAAELPRPQGRPAPEAVALAPAAGPVAERAWLRESLALEFDAMAGSVAFAVAEHTGAWVLGQVAEDDVHTDAVAVRLYLSAHGEKIDRALRLGETGPHVPLARCAAAGLARLPAHRGAVGYRASPTPAQLQLYRDHDVVTDWGFTNALTEPCPSRPGEVDVLLWSMTARLTQALEPEGDEQVLGRTLFLPGTSFRVLEVVAPEHGRRGRLLLREISGQEADPALTQQAGHLDELATNSLRAAAERWAQAPPNRKVGTAAHNRFGELPGLLPR